MPRVTAYGQPRVTLQPFPNARRDARQVSPSANALGAQKGVALANLGGSVADIGLRGLADVQAERDRKKAAARTRADQLAVQQADNDLSDWTRKRLRDPQAGALQVRGRDAAALPDTVGEEFDKTADHLATTLSTPEQRDAFSRVRAQQRGALDDTLSRHVSDEITKYDAAETARGIENAQQDAIANAANPQMTAVSLLKMRALIVDHAAANGMGPEATKAAINSAVTTTHVGVIDQLLATGQEKAAAVYFEEFQGEISADSWGKVERALEEGNLRGESQRLSDEILRTAETETEALEQVRAIEDPKLRDATQTRVEHGLSIKHARDRAVAEATMVDAANRLEASRGNLAAIPPGVWAELPVTSRNALKSYAKALQPDAPGDVETNLPTYYGLMQQASTAPEKFADVNLLNYLGKLGKTEFKQLTELQNSIRKGDKPKAEAELDGFRTNEQIVNDTLDMAGITRTGDDADHETVARFRRTVDERVMALQRLTNKKATNEDIQQIADDLLKSVTLEKGSWLGVLPGIPFYDRTKRLIDITVEDIAPLDRRQIEDALRKTGRPITDDTVLNLYLATQRRLGGAK